MLIGANVIRTIHGLSFLAEWLSDSPNVLNIKVSPSLKVPTIISYVDSLNLGRYSFSRKV